MFIQKVEKDCEKLNKLLNKNNISSNYYHVGISISERNKSQFNWKNSKTKVMVLTNAFGMGIDKSDVRLVIHFHIPKNIESYYQETGKRVETKKNLMSILLYNNNDVKVSTRICRVKLPKTFRYKRCLSEIVNYFHLTINCGERRKF